MMTPGKIPSKSLCGTLIVALITCGYTLAQTRSAPVDPGVRGGPAGAGGPLPGLTADETGFFLGGQARFSEIEVVNKGANNGLGPRFNSNQCFSCHSQPNLGGTSPAKNPLPDVAALDGAKNAVPWFIVPNGPVREARFQKSNGNADGEVHDLFVITGGLTPPVVISPNSIFYPREIRLRGKAGIETLFSEFRLPSLVQGSSRRFPIRLSLPTNRRTHQRSRNWVFTDTRTLTSAETSTSVPTMERSPVSDGRRRTNPFSCSRARPTTSRWEFRTRYSHKSATKHRLVSSTPLPTTPLSSQPLPRPLAIRAAFRTPRSSPTSKRLPTSCDFSLHPRPLHPHHPAKRDATCLT